MSTELVERVAKLFSAGSYPDRGIEIDEGDLDRITESHAPVPIKVEHTETPFQIGTLERIWRIGKDLFGKLVFSKAAWELIRESGARGLSVAIKRDKSGLTEVSVVRQPRIADAVLFSDESVGFSFDIDGGEEMSETKQVEFSERVSELEQQLKSREVDGRINSLKRAGKLAPAGEGLARVLLSAGDAQVVTFADGTEKPVAETFLAFLEAQPKVIEFSELAHSSSESEIPESEREVYAKLGVSPAAAQKYRGR